MRVYTVARSSVILAFTFGISIAVGAVVWQYGISPYRTPPLKPEFVNKPKPTKSSMPLAKFIVPKKTKQFMPNSPEVKYQGTVNASRGLVLRANPKQGAARVGGVEYKANISVLKETPDKQWVYIRNQVTKEAGWVRAGNIFRN